MWNIKKFQGGTEANELCSSWELVCSRKHHVNHVYHVISFYALQIAVATVTYFLSNIIRASAKAGNLAFLTGLLQSCLFGRPQLNAGSHFRRLLRTSKTSRRRHCRIHVSTGCFSFKHERNNCLDTQRETRWSIRFQPDYACRECYVSVKKIATLFTRPKKQINKVHILKCGKNDVENGAFNVTGWSCVTDIWDPDV